MLYYVGYQDGQWSIGNAYATEEEVLEYIMRGNGMQFNAAKKSMNHFKNNKKKRR